MKLLEKLKNTFFEEEYIEVEEPVKKEESIAKKIEPKEVKKEIPKASAVEEEIEVIEEPEVENYSDNQLTKADSKLPYFEDEDFVEVDNYKQEEKPKTLYGGDVDQVYNSLHSYTNPTSGKPYGANHDSFKPTPIISPIYGILDKNYTKDEVIDKKDKPSSYVSRKNMDLDSVRRKAYGGLTPFDDVVNYTEEVEEEKIEEDNNLLYDMTDINSKPQVEHVTIADAEEYFSDLGLEYNVDYKDSGYEKATGRRTTSNDRIYQEEVEEDVKLEETDIKQDINENIDEDSSDNDNLFDLIDSMYEEGEE